MKNLIIISLVFLIACSANKAIPTNIISSKSAVTKDSVVTKHDTIVKPGESILIVNESPCQPNVDYNQSVKSKGLSAGVSIKDGKIKVECKVDSLLLVIEQKNHYINTLQNFSETKINESVKYIEHIYNPWSLYISIAAIIAAITWLYLKIKN